MSCACENKKYSSEYERMKRLAKATAAMTGKTIALFKNADGTFDFSESFPEDKSIIEYISPY